MTSFLGQRQALFAPCAARKGVAARHQPRRAVSQPARASLLGWQDSWEPKDAPDLTGRRFLVTGSTTGLGYETSKWLASKNAEVILAGRSDDGLEKAKRDAEAEAGPNAVIKKLKFDLESLRDVQRAAEEFKSWNQPLDVLVNNAGLFLPPHSVTEDGIEVQLQMRPLASTTTCVELHTNYFAHWLLTHLLLDNIRAAAKKAPARIVWTTSQANAFGKINWDDLRGERDTKSDIDMYAQSKVEMLLASLWLHKHFSSEGITSLAAHPGIADTNIYAHQEGTDKATANTQQALNPLIGQDQKRGGLSLFRAVADPSLNGHGGKVVGPSQLIFNMGDATAERDPVNPLAQDEGAAERLVRETVVLLEKQLGTKLPALVPSLV